MVKTIASEVRLPFENREEAAYLLAKRLEAWKGKRPLILAIPRGAVPMGRILARELGGDLDVVLVRKIGAPFQPELAVGAVDEAGHEYRSPQAEGLGIPEAYFARQREKQLALMRRRRHLYTPARVPREVGGRPVIVLDDGIATGSTMIAALKAVRARHPSRLIVATAVAPPPTVERLREFADDVVCLASPEHFAAVGEFFRDFSQVSDEEVIRILGDPPDKPEIAEMSVRVTLGDLELSGDLSLPENPRGLVLFAHGSESSRRSPRNRYVASVLHQAGIVTLLFDLLTPREDQVYRNRFEIKTLASRLVAATRQMRRHPCCLSLPFGYFGASTGAAAALKAAAELGETIVAVVSRGGRPDLAMSDLSQVKAPTLLLVGGEDRQVLELNRKALAEIAAPKELIVIPGATHLFEEAGTLEQVAGHATRWFQRCFSEP